MLHSATRWPFAFVFSQLRKSYSVPSLSRLPTSRQRVYICDSRNSLPEYYAKEFESSCSKDIISRTSWQSCRLTARRGIDSSNELLPCVGKPRNNQATQPLAEMLHLPPLCRTSMSEQCATRQALAAVVDSGRTTSLLRIPFSTSLLSSLTHIPPASSADHQLSQRSATLLSTAQSANLHHTSQQQQQLHNDLPAFRYPIHPHNNQPTNQHSWLPPATAPPVPRRLATLHLVTHRQVLHQLVPY